jgi:hypothetical protein
MPPMGAAGLAAETWLYMRRAPGNACLTGLAQGGEPGVNPDSKGCGTVMRSAPFGLLASSPVKAFELARDCSAITHGHRTAGEAAGAFALMIAALVRGESPQKAVSEAMLHLRRNLDVSETLDSLRRAYELAGNLPPGPNTTVGIAPTLTSGCVVAAVRSATSKVHSSAPLAAGPPCAP